MEKSVDYRRAQAKWKRKQDKAMQPTAQDLYDMEVVEEMD